MLAKFQSMDIYSREAEQIMRPEPIVIKNIQIQLPVVFHDVIAFAPANDEFELFIPHGI